MLFHSINIVIMHSNHLRNMLDWSMDASSILSWDQQNFDGGYPSRYELSKNSNGNIGMESCCEYPSSLTSSMMSSMTSACLTPCTPANDPESWVKDVGKKYLFLNDDAQNELLNHLISLSGPKQLHHLSTKLDDLLKRDFIRFLPYDLCSYLLQYLDPRTLLICCSVSRCWYRIISKCFPIWQRACKSLSIVLPVEVSNAALNGERNNAARSLKALFIRSKARLDALRSNQGFDTTELNGHKDRVMVVNFKDGKLATGSDDLSIRIWDCISGRSLKVIRTHTVADIKFDEKQVLSASFDNTIACWDYETGVRRHVFFGHVGAVFSIDYCEPIDLLVSGSADMTVKLWSFSSGTLIYSQHVYTEWVTKVILHQCQEDCEWGKRGSYILLGQDKYDVVISRLDQNRVIRSEESLISGTGGLLPNTSLQGSTLTCCRKIPAFVKGDFYWSQWTFGLETEHINQRIEFEGKPSVVTCFLGLGKKYGVLLGEQDYLYIWDVVSQALLTKQQLPNLRNSKRGSTVVLCSFKWLDGFDGENDQGPFLAASRADHIVQLLTWSDLDLPKKL